MNDDLKALRKKVKKALDKERWEHTKGVTYTAAALAMAHGVNIEDAMTAGLLHDCAKCIPNEKKLSLCKEYKLRLKEVEKKNPSLIHAKLGAFLAKEKYGITKKSILSAIACHTTGAPKMSRLDKIIFIADYIEPDRVEAPNLMAVRRLAFRDLDRCMCRILSDTLTYLKGTDREIDPVTKQTFQVYKSLVDGEKHGA